MPCREVVVMYGNHMTFLDVYIVEIQIQSCSDGSFVGIGCSGDRYSSSGRLAVGFTGCNGCGSGSSCLCACMFHLLHRIAQQLHHKHKQQQYAEHYAYAYACHGPYVAPINV